MKNPSIMSDCTTILNDKKKTFSEKEDAYVKKATIFFHY